MKQEGKKQRASFHNLCQTPFIPFTQDWDPPYREPSGPCHSLVFLRLASLMIENSLNISLHTAVVKIKS